MKKHQVTELAGKLMQASYTCMKVMEMFNCVTTQYIDLQNVTISFYPEDTTQLEEMKNFIMDEIAIYYESFEVEDICLELVF